MSSTTNFLELINSECDLELGVFLGADDRPDAAVTPMVQDDVAEEIHDVIPTLPMKIIKWDPSASSHYLNSKWLASHCSYISVGPKGPIIRVMPGTSFVKYIGSCTGGVRIRNDDIIIDRSGGYYYLGTGMIGSSVMDCRFSHLANEFRLSMEERQLVWLHHKFNLIPIKFSQLGSMYNYIVIYSIRLPIPVSCCSIVGEFVGFSSSFYDRRTNRFYRVADHHSARKIRSMPYEDIVCFLVFKRKDFVDHLLDEFVTGQSADWVWGTVRSMMAAVGDIICTSSIAVVALKSRNDIKSSLVCLDGGIPHDVQREICSWLGDGCGIIGNNLVSIVEAPQTASIDADYDLFVHEEWDSSPNMVNGHLRIGPA